ncbi:MAG: inositol monophosphatase [Acidimicrobiaceae bacterium]|nr:inositol monophosphatase [Acidimicrobiaceae bacterium]
MKKLSVGSSNDEIVQVLHEVADATYAVLSTNTDWGLSGQRPTQYSIDLRTDAAALEVLHGAGCAVLSEESGRTGDWHADAIIVVMDPLDGSTNASRRVPWYATALAALDASGQRASLVANQFTNTDRWTATTGGGAFHNGVRISPSSCTQLAHAVVGVSGLPKKHPGWAQFRALGAAALDICLVAQGTLDGWVDLSSHGVWDYLASVHICAEAGAVVGEMQDRNLIVTEHAERRSPIVAATPELFALLQRVHD